VQRLVYSPKAFVYVKNRNGQILDLSRYVVSGSVNRRINQVSSATVQLRNPNMIWTVKGRDNHQAFLPMDPITIYLMRVKGRPVRVFTGFLDTIPFYEMYPGTITLNASCTLKKLLYTFFDPALPYTRDFLTEYGWYPDANGSLKNPDALAQVLKTDKDDPRTKLTDGSIGNLLYATLKHIGGWKSHDIFIEQLPMGIVQRMQDLYKKFDESNKLAKDEWEKLMHDIIGSAAFGGAGGSASGGPVGNVGGVPKKFIPIYIAAASKYHLGDKGPSILAAIHSIESAFGTNMGSSSAGAIGHMQFMPGTWATYGVDANHDGKKDPFNADDAIFAAARYLSASGAPGNWHDAIFAYNHAEWYVQDVLKAAEKFYRATKENDPQADENKPDEPKNKKTSVTDAGAPTEAPAQIVQAKYVSEYERLHPEAPRLGPPRRSPSSSSDQKIYRPINGNGSYGRGWHESTKGVTGRTNTSGHWHWHSGLDYAVPGGTPCVAPADGVITMATLSWSDGGMVHFKFTQDVGDIKAGTIIGWGHIQSKSVNSGDKVRGGQEVARSGVPSGGAHVHFIQTDASNESSGGGDGTTDPAPLLHALQQGKTSPTSGGNAGSGGGGGGGTGNLDDMYSVAKASAFAAQLEWPTMEETIEAIGLQGQKSLMNDKPLMPFIQQLTDASLRQFQSMPNGDFFGFYPDYFGEFNHRKPYWYINDIEILNGRIQLTDDALATHVYVVGDTLPGMNDYVNKLFSAGVINVFNVFGAEGVLNRDAPLPSDDPKGTDRQVSPEEDSRDLMPVDDAIDAAAFLRRYGARPSLHEEAFIRSPYFEAFMAYQTFMLMWSRQFLTTFTFTFMPELYPGGHVGFPEHGLQMYIDEVEHSWDYESGFTTTANLSAPSVLRMNDGTPVPDAPLPENMMLALVDAVPQTKKPLKFDNPTPIP
jgi:murein DD-endopeptidase MepM/ murein hydrolase activator NlpD